MTYIVSSGALNFTHSLTHCKYNIKTRVINVISNNNCNENLDVSEDWIFDIKATNW